MALTADSLLPTITPFLGTAMDVIIIVVQLIALLGGLGYIVLLYMFDTKLNIREVSKGNRVIVHQSRARKIKDKRTGTPRLMLFSLNPMVLFGMARAQMINEPPAECLVPFKSRLTNKLYDLVKKDGIYYPVQNFILGYKHDVMNEKTKQVEEVWSMKGSGLEISRDYDAEQAIENMLIEKATTYRSKKPVEIVTGLALVIICVITSGVIMYFAWKQFGNMAGAIASLQQPLKEGIQGAVQSALGPG